MHTNPFDKRIAKTYEARWPELFDIPLRRRGVPVHGIDRSPHMVTELRAKPGGDAVAVTIGDFATTRAGGPLQRLPPGETVRPFTVTPEHLGFEEYEVATQIAFSHHYWVIDGQLETMSAPFRYVWPSELDLMARLAGMSLRERWSDWSRAPFTGDSRGHVSVWEKPAAAVT